MLLHTFDNYLEHTLLCRFDEFERLFRLFEFKSIGDEALDIHFTRCYEVDGVGVAAC